MRFRFSLHRRVGLAFAALGAAVALLLAGGLFMAVNDLERRLIDEALSADLEDYVARRERNPNSLPPTTATLRGYIRSGVPVDDALLPDAVAALEPGYHGLQLEGRSYRAVVADQGGNRFYMLYDQTQAERREHALILFLVAGVIAMSLLSAAGGLWLARRVIAPVTLLAQRVAALRPDDIPESLAEDYPKDEVGELARAFDRYLERLDAFIERERAFTSEVSHELRTPLAAIAGAVEVLLADGTFPPRIRERLKRIERNATEMGEVTEALLLLAREEEGGGAGAAYPLEEVLRDVLEKNRPLLAAKPVALHVDICAHPQVTVARPVLAIVLGNLARNAFAYTEQGMIRVILREHAVEFQDTGPGIDAEDLPHVFERYYRGRGGRGAGIGLALVKRICERYGWRIELTSTEGAGTLARLAFRS